MAKNNRISSKKKFTIENVRCFDGRQTFEIRPLTFLIGENSTGKTTALGCFHVIDSISFARLNVPDFNIEPYRLGSFDDIVRRNNGSGNNKGKKTEFELGLDWDTPKTKYTVRFVGRDKGSEPVVSHTKIDSPNFFISIDSGITGGKPSCIVSLKNRAGNDNDPLEIELPKSLRDTESILHFPLFLMLEEELPKDHKDVLRDVVSELHRAYGVTSKVVSLAPIRSKPQRTYDPIREILDPEGSDVPIALMRLHREGEERWKPIRNKLVRFGKSSGLFTDIEVRNFGESMGDPFQLQFKVRGAKSNIMDTGYGVSQILPLLVRMFLSSGGNSFLLQQPEVHLHPRAQAELSSLLIESAKTTNNSFLIETHSDYMVNRASIEIRRGNISPDEVSLIYLKPVSDRVEVHNLSFDNQGNLLNAPDGYRDFFLKEDDRLLGFED